MILVEGMRVRLKSEDECREADKSGKWTPSAVYNMPFGLEVTVTNVGSMCGTQTFRILEDSDWNYCEHYVEPSSLGPPPPPMTNQEIADKFGVPVESLTIEED